MPKEKASWRWEVSQAKEDLRSAIISGRAQVPEGRARPAQNDAIHNLTSELRKTDRSRISSRAKHLQLQLKSDNKSSNEDAEDLANDRALFPKPTRNYRDEPRWPGSAAEASLQEDVLAGKHKAMKPSQLYQSRPEYQEQMTLQHFRPKVYQEEKRMKFNRYRRDTRECKMLPTETEAQYRAQLKEERKKKREKKEQERELRKTEPLHPLA